MKIPPPPRETAQKWLAFGAIVVVVVGVSFASRAFKTHLKETLPQPEPRPYLPPNGLEDPPQSQPNDPDDAPPADDEVPKQPSTIEGSKAARPAWSPTASYAPQHSKANDLYLLAETIDKPLFRRFVICKVTVNTPLDGELELRLDVGATPEVIARGASSDRTVYVSAPLASLERQEKLRLRVSLRQGTKTNDLARLSDDLADGTIAFPESTAIDADCSTIDPSEIDKRVAKDAGRADGALHRLALPKLDASKDDWAYPNEELARIRQATSDVAALVGWDDDRTKRRVSGLVGVQATLETASAPVFESFHRSATKTALAADLEVTLESLSCAKGKPCVAKLSIENPTDHAIAWSGEDAPRTYVATRYGGPIFFERDEETTKEIAAGATLKDSMALPETLSANEPAILGICSASRCSALVLR